MHWRIPAHNSNIVGRYPLILNLFHNWNDMMNSTLARKANQNLIQFRAMKNALADAGLKIGDRIEVVTTRSAVTAKNGYSVPSWGVSEYRLVWGVSGRPVWRYVCGTGKYTTIPDCWAGLPHGRPNMINLKKWAKGLITY